MKLNTQAASHYAVGGPGSAFTSILYPFTDGTPFPLSLSVHLQADLSEEDTTQDFAGTIDQISVFDSRMHPLKHYRLVSASGTDYPAVGAVPEPGSVFLLITAMLGCAGIARKARRSAVSFARARLS